MKIPSGDTAREPDTHGRAARGAAPNGKENGRKHVHTDGKRATEALGDLGSYIAELKDQASLLVAAKVDGIKASMRRLVFYAALGLLGLVLLAVTVVGGATYCFQGLAGGLGQLFGIPWLGDLVTGVLLLGSIVLASTLGLKMWTRASTKATMRKYEERRTSAGRAREPRATEPH